MNAPRVAVGAALLAVAAWIAKGIAIGVAGGLDRSPLEAPLFIVGLVAVVVACAAFGFAATARRPTWARAAAAVASVVAGTVLTLLAQAVSGTLLPERTGWVQEEAGLWAGSILIAAIVVLVLGRGGGLRARSSHTASTAER